MGVSDKVWDALANVIKMNDKIVALTQKVETQQMKIENLTGRVIRLETTIELLMKASEIRRLPK